MFSILVWVNETNGNYHNIIYSKNYLLIFLFGNTYNAFIKSITMIPIVGIFLNILSSITGHFEREGIGLIPDNGKYW